MKRRTTRRLDPSGCRGPSPTNVGATFANARSALATRPLGRFAWPLLVLLALTGGCGDSTKPDGKPADSTTGVETSNGTPTATDSGLGVLTADRLPAGPEIAPWFDVVADRGGIDFVHDSGVSELREFPAANGSGIAMLDVDLDGRYDLYFASGTEFPVDPAAEGAIDRCYRNVGGMRFVEMTAPAGLGHPGYSAGVTVGDYDSDGFPDLYVACYGRNVLYRNQGDGSFVETSAASGTDDPEWATSAAFFDGDDDGDLDLYVCNYGYWTLETNGYCHADGNRAVRLFCSPKSIKPCPDKYFENLGDGTFADRSVDSGLTARAGRAQGVVAADMDDDGRTDLYLGNDLNANSLFISVGGGKFEDRSEISGVAYSQRGLAQAGMGVDAADFNRDGAFDLFVTNFKDEYSALYENRERGLFFDVSIKHGGGRETLPYVSWGTAMGDYDLDGWLDLLVVNGHVDDNRALAGEDAPYLNPALLFRNEQGTFRCLHRAAGGYFSEFHSSRALVIGDLDEDGDQDFVVGHQNEAPSLVRNRVHSEGAGSGPPSLQLRFVGVRSNRDGIGARIGHRFGDLPYADQVTGGGSYLSQSDYRLVLALPTADSASALDLRFPGSDNQARTVDGFEPNGTYVVIESSDSNAPPRIRRIDTIR